MGIFASFVGANVNASRAFDRLFPAHFCIDGNKEYLRDLVPQYVTRGDTVYDVGGGKQPYFSVDAKRELNLRIVGVDISSEELGRAAYGCYDKKVAADICTYRGEEDGDLVICQALLEHVPDTQAALRSIASILRPGGNCLLFVPCRNAAFARLNLLLPEACKRKILFTVFPSTRHAQGFRSYYDRCTPRAFSEMAEKCGLEVLDLRCYHMSSYFSFFFPLYVVWRLWTVLTVAFGAENMCETFSMVLRRENNVKDNAANIYQ